MNTWTDRVVIVAWWLLLGCGCTPTASPAGSSGGRGAATGGATSGSGGGGLATGGQTTLGTGGNQGGPSGGATGSGGVGGVLGGTGGSGGGGSGATAGGGTGGAGDVLPTGGKGGTAVGGQGAPVSGTAGRGGGGGTGGGAGARVVGTGGAGQGGTTGFVCNQVTGMTLTREWFEAGFETNPGIINARWQLKAREHGYITEWANPDSTFWNEPVSSPCAAGSTSPDHVVLTVLSWVPDCCTTQPQWETQITAAINNLKTKYPGLKRIDLITVIRGPGNMLCPAAPAAGETIVIPPQLDGALAAAAAQFPGLVFVAPKFEAPNCAAFSGGGPHLTTAGNTAVAKVISAAFVNLQ